MRKAQIIDIWETVRETAILILFGAVFWFTATIAVALHNAPVCTTVQVGTTDGSYEKEVCD